MDITEAKRLAQRYIDMMAAWERHATAAEKQEYQLGLEFPKVVKTIMEHNRQLEAENGQLKLAAIMKGQKA